MYQMIQTVRDASTISINELVPDLLHKEGADSLLHLLYDPNCQVLSISTKW